MRWSFRLEMKFNSFLMRYCSYLVCSSVEFDDLRRGKKSSKAADADTSLLLIFFIIIQIIIIHI